MIVPSPRFASVGNGKAIQHKKPGTWCDLNDDHVGNPANSTPPSHPGFGFSAPFSKSGAAKVKSFSHFIHRPTYDSSVSVF